MCHELISAIGRRLGFISAKYISHSRFSHSSLLKGTSFPSVILIYPNYHFVLCSKYSEAIMMKLRELITRLIRKNTELNHTNTKVDSFLVRIRL